MKFESTLHKQRFVLGVICGLLPICCVLFGLFGKSNDPRWWYSISATYYANSSPWMIGSLVLCSFFFFTYQGYDLGDKWFTKLSSIASMGIVIFPCWNSNYNFVGLFQIPTKFSSMLHNIFATVLFVAFGAMICFLFTKGSNKVRNRIYRICGCLIFVGIVTIGLGNVFDWPGYSVIISEFIILESFAVAWIVKSRVV